jgi:drug/metabolite transporter (DMT)-like permease
MDSAQALALGLGLFSAITLAGANTAVKAGGDILAGRAILSVTSALILLPFAFFLPLPTPEVWAALALSLPAHIFYQISTIRAMHRGDLSLVFPVMRGLAPLLTAAVAYIALSERLSGLELFGLVIATLSVIAFAIPQGAGAHLPKDRAALFWAGCTAIGIALYNVADANGVRTAQNPFTYIVWLFLLDWIMVTLMMVTIRRGTVIETLRARWRTGVVAGILAVLSFGSLMYGFTLVPAAMMSALRETAVVFGALLGWKLLREGFGPRRVIAALIMALGLVLMQGPSLFGGT